MKIKNFNICSDRTFVIAEVGNNHNGSIENAFTLVDHALDAGADCVKFQMRHMEEVYRSKSLTRNGEDLGTEYVLDLLDRYQLTIEEHERVSKYCQEKNIIYMCTPWDVKSLDILETFKVPCYKVASADLTNMPLIDKISDTGKPIILSTGMSKLEEIIKTSNFLKSKSSDYIFLHCNSTYPAPYHDINLNFLNELKKIHKYIGYSGHERGIYVSLAAVAMGALVIERHLTLDRNMEGPDHAASLEYKEFKDLITGIRQIDESKGVEGERLISQGEMINRENLAKSLVASKKLKKGTILKKEHIKVLSPGQGLSPQYFEDLVGCELKHDMNKEDYFFMTDIVDIKVEPKSYNFSRPWGVPVRYHDIKEYSSKIKPDIYEFHLSYSDLDLDINLYLDKKYDCDFVVHAPELFENSILMDLASPDNDYRNLSIKETQRVIDMTRELKNYFPSTKRPLLVANIGGFSMDSPIATDKLPSYYEHFKNSLDILDMEGVELIPQTMAPFPWHFGGQRYQNMFVHPDEIVKWCESLNLRMCFDISHSKLTCNYFDIDFYDFSKKVAKYSAHLHLGDAKGFNGEGLQIGEGEVDFHRLAKIFDDLCPDASFIPEIWQGHKNGGEGFWIALEKLNSIF